MTSLSPHHNPLRPVMRSSPHPVAKLVGDCRITFNPALGSGPAVSHQLSHYRTKAHPAFITAAHKKSPHAFAETGVVQSGGPNRLLCASTGDIKTMDRKRIPAGLSPATFVEQAEAWAKELEDRAARRRGLSLDIARAEVARKAGVPSGLLRSLRKRRIKDIGAAAYVSIRRALINELIEEVLRAQHELSVAEATGADPFGDEMASLDEDIDRLHALLKREVEP